jgi:hypothetical protein
MDESVASALIVTTESALFKRLPFPVQTTDRLATAIDLCKGTSFRAVFCSATQLADGGNGFRLGMKLRQLGIDFPLYLMTRDHRSDRGGMTQLQGLFWVIGCTPDAVVQAYDKLSRAAQRALRRPDDGVTSGMAVANPAWNDSTRTSRTGLSTSRRSAASVPHWSFDSNGDESPPSRPLSLARGSSAMPVDRINLGNRSALDDFRRRAGPALKIAMGPVASLVCDDVIRGLLAQHPKGISEANVVRELAMRITEPELRSSFLSRMALSPTWSTST